MITLGRRAFGGPFLLPLWSAPKTAGICAVMVPGWKLLTFRALHFQPTESFSIETVKGHTRYAEWLSIAGSEWNLYVATHEMSFSAPAERAAVERELARDYKPEFNAPVPAAGQDAAQADLRTLLLARAMRANLQE